MPTVIENKTKINLIELFSKYKQLVVYFNKDEKNKRNFHLQKKVGNNVRKLFLKVFLKVGFNKWQECLRLSTQSCGKDRPSVCAWREERAHSREGN